VRARAANPPQDDQKNFDLALGIIADALRLFASDATPRDSMQAAMHLRTLRSALHLYNSGLGATEIAIAMESIERVIQELDPDRGAEA
jgi:hypothetical protein